LRPSKAFSDGGQAGIQRISGASSRSLLQTQSAPLE